MPLFEAVAIGVGGAIAKSILKVWVGDDVSSTIVDVLKSKTSDVLAQRRGQRQFDTIGEKIGESLLPLFESEGSQLDEGSRIAIAHEVAAAFNTSRLSSELLAKRNLDPTELARQVLATHSIAGQPFSDTEKAFYQRIIHESCAYIVDIASQLPAFSERTFAEVLKREDVLIARADEILREIQHLRQQLDPMSEAGRFEEDYRKGVVRKLDELQLFGTDVSNASRRHRLSVAYITLSAEQKLLSLPTSKQTVNNVESDMLEGSEEEPVRDIVSVDRALASSRNLLIRGEAGSGKTTLLQWIAVKSASKSFEKPLADWNDTIPFFIRLRHCVQEGLPKPESFPGLVVPAIADTMPKGWVHTQLKTGLAIVLIDGLDEVPLLHREDIRSWLKELAEVYPVARFVITSRPHAVEEGWMDAEGFGNAELQPMELADISMFIDHWHQAVREELQEQTEKDELASQAAHLLEDVKGNRSLRNLATSPLLCVMLSALNRDRRQQLPTDRVELYEACCSLLLERRDKERRIELSDYPALTYRQKRLLLEDLAYWMIKNEWSEVALTLVEERFTRKLRDMPAIPSDVTGSGVRRLFVERSGIIREPVTGQIDFTHRTFQEFLAAKASVDEMDTGLLVEKAENDQWREVIILASGLATKQIREELIKGLIDRGDTDKEHRHQLHLLAVSCLETSVELGQEVRAEVEQRLSKLVPPKNMTDAKALAAAGELAVKYLANKGKRLATINAACVRTLVLIGSDAALDKLKEYATDTRSTVVDELLKGWDSFDRESYAKNILLQTLQQEYRWLPDRLSSLEGFQYFTSLTTLNLSGCQQVSNLTPLAHLIHLTSLNLSGCQQVSDLSPLAHLIHLTSLNLFGCQQVNDLSPLAYLTNLSLSWCKQLSDLTPLAHLTYLTSLDLSWCEHLTDLTPLAHLTNLTSLNFSMCEQLSDLKPLAHLTSLTNLNLSSCKQVSDLTPLAHLTSLTSLNLYRCEQLSDLSPLAHLINLTHLDLSWCEQLSDLSPLAHLTNLTSLNLSACGQVSDLTPLAHLTNLTSLDLSWCRQVSDFSSLTKLNNLQSLILSRTTYKVAIPQSIKKIVHFFW
jgi:NACHT domain/Leucine Rich repeats (2 copies)/Leucine Rich repeat